MDEHAGIQGFEGKHHPQKRREQRWHTGLTGQGSHPGRGPTPPPEPTNTSDRASAATRSNKARPRETSTWQRPNVESSEGQAPNPSSLYCSAPLDPSSKTKPSRSGLATMASDCREPPLGTLPPLSTMAFHLLAYLKSMLWPSALSVRVCHPSLQNSGLCRTANQPYGQNEPKGAWLNNEPSDTLLSEGLDERAILIVQKGCRPTPTGTHPVCWRRQAGKPNDFLRQLGRILRSVNSSRPRALTSKARTYFVPLMSLRDSLKSG